MPSLGSIARRGALTSRTQDATGWGTTIQAVGRPIGYVLDFLARPAYASASAALAIQEGRSLPEIFQSALRGLTGQQRASYRDVAVRAGLSEEPLIEAFRGIPILGASPAGILGFAGDVFLDPTSYIGIGGLNRAGVMARRGLGETAQTLAPRAARELAQEATERARAALNVPREILEEARRSGGYLPSAVQRAMQPAPATYQEIAQRAPRSAQALAGMRDIVTFAGVGPSSLPGGLGAIARRGQAAVFRALERTGQRLADVPLVERVMQDVSSMGTGIRRVFRERIREMEGREQYRRILNRRAQTEFNRNLREVAERYGVEREELMRAVVVEAERPQGVAAMLGPDRLVRYRPKGGETIGEIAQRFGIDPETLKLINGMEWVRDDVPLARQLGEETVFQVPTPIEAVLAGERLHGHQAKLLAMERERRIPTPVFESERIRYVHRALDPSSEKAMREADREFFRRNVPVFSVRHGAQKGRRIDADRYIAEINQAAIEGRTAQVWREADGTIHWERPEGWQISADKQYIWKREGRDIKRADRYIVVTDVPQSNPALPKRPLFSESPAYIMYQRENMTIKVTEAADAINDLIEVGTREGWAVRNVTPELAQELQNAGWRQVTAPRFGELLDGVWFHHEAANEMDRFFDLYFNRQTQNIFASAMKGITSWWRDMTLFMFPAYHARNLMTGVLKNYYAGINPLDGRAYYKGQAFAVYRWLDAMAPRNARAAELRDRLARLSWKDARGKEWTLQELSDFYTSRTLNFGYFDQFDERQVIENIFGEAQRGFDALSLIPFMPGGRNTWVKLGRDIGTFLEDGFRGTLFIDQILKGETVEQAANMVRARHFDYRDIPDWLRSARDWAVPFVTWAWKNIPDEILNLATQPGKIARIQHVYRAVELEAEGPKPERHEVPDYLPMPVYIGRDKDGNAVFTNALNAWAFADLASWAENPLAEAFNLLNGVIQEVWSQTINYDLYQQREIVPRELAEVGFTLGPPTEPFGLPSRVQSAMETLRAAGTATNIARAFMGLGERSLPNVISQTLTSIGTYPTNPYYAEVAPYRNVQTAASYLRGRIRGALQRAREAEALGDTRRAEHERRQAERYTEMMRQLAGRLPLLLPQTGEPTP